MPLASVTATRSGRKSIP